MTMRKILSILVVFVLVVLQASAVFAVQQNPHVTIVNPADGHTLYADNLLVSVKLTQPATIEVSVLRLWKAVGGTNEPITLEEYQSAQSADSRVEIVRTEFAKMDAFTSVNHLSFYTKRIENVTPGVYEILVGTLDAEGGVIGVNASVVDIKAKEENPVDATPSTAPQSGPSQFLKNLLKSIFGS